MRNCNKRSGLKENTPIIFQFWGSDVPLEVLGENPLPVIFQFWRSDIPLEVLGENPLPGFSSFWRRCAFLDARSLPASSKTISSASASIVTAPLMLSPPPPSFTYRDSVIILDPLGDQRYSLKPICRAAMETQIWRTDLWTQWGRESGTNGESGRETCTLPYVNRQSGRTCCITQGAQTAALRRQPRGIGWGGRCGDVQGGGDVRSQG